MADKLKTQVEDPTKPDAPKDQHSQFEAAKEKFAAHTANLGPAVSQAFAVPEEGSKEERRKLAEKLNSENKE